MFSLSLNNFIGNVISNAISNNNSFSNTVAMAQEYDTYGR